MGFYALRYEVGLNRDKAAKLFEAVPRTTSNWDTRKIRPPRAVFLHLHVLCGHLDQMSAFFLAADKRGQKPDGD
jgi:hypothetical protein